jgi:hypothetical protein
MLLPQPISFPPLVLLVDGAAFFARDCVPFGEVADGWVCWPLISNVCDHAQGAHSTTEQNIKKTEFFFTRE